MVQLSFHRKAYINVRMLLRTVGWLLMVLAGFMIFPLVVSFIYHDSNTVPILISMGITLICAGALMSLKSKSREMGRREAFLLTALTWIILSLFGMLPFLLCGTHDSVTDAFFETMSGFTTTGASTLPTLNGLPHSILLWRCVLQWIGGLGIILFTLAVVPMLNYQGGMLMFNAEVTGITHDKLRPRVSNTAKSLWKIYIVLTLTCILLLWISKMNLFEAVCHGLSTMSTGGFSTSDMRASEWDSPYIIVILTVFMFLGGVNFNLIFASIHGEFKRVKVNDAFRWFCFVAFGGYIIFLFALMQKGLIHDWKDATIVPLFQSISILSSTGLMEPDFSAWGSLSFIILIVLMAIGGCAGSTSGGAKIDRFVILFRFIKNEFYKMMHPSAVTTVVVNGKGTSYMIVMKVLAFIAIYFLVILIGGFILSVMGVPITQSFFYALSSVSNAGIGTNIPGVASCFAILPCGAKWVMSFIMLTGRLELYTVLLLFTRTFWRQ